MLESYVEGKLKALESFGFKSLKLRTPGYNGTKDRLLLWPTWSPGPKGPVFVEVKGPGKYERALQEAVRNDWRARGCDVRDMVDTPEKVQALCDNLLIEAVDRLPAGSLYDPHDIITQRRMPSHICVAYVLAKKPK